MGDLSVLDAATLADIELESVAGTLNSAPGPAVTPRAQVADAVIDRVRHAAPHASADALARVRGAQHSGAWLNEPQAAYVEMALAAALARHGPAGTGSPLDAGQLQSLAHNDDGALVDETIALWLDHFAGDPRDVWQVVQPFADQPLPARTAAALSRLAERLDDDERLQLLDEPVTLAVEDGAVHSSFFTAARLVRAPAIPAARRIVKLFEQADDRPRAGAAVLDLWRGLGPASPTAQKELVDGVYLPLAASGDQGLQLALDGFSLVAGVRDVRRKVKDALRGAARTKKQRESVEARLLEAGWARRTGRIRKRTTDVDEHER